MKAVSKDDFLIRDDITFLNHGSFGACPLPVYTAWQEWQRRMERDPVAFLHRDLAGHMRYARTILAAELGAAPENIVGVANATMGLNIVAQSLPLAAGDQILTTTHEYAALEKTWEFVCRQTGAEIIAVDIPLPLINAACFTKTLVKAMTERTRALFLSHITSPTALCFPLADAIAEARERSILTIIDGAHAPGHIPLSLDRLGADFYAGNCHKWMMAPKGAAFLYARPEVQGRINPLVISHGWVNPDDHDTDRGPFGNSHFVDMIEMQGTRDPSAFLTVPDAITYRHANDWEVQSARCRALAQETAARMERLTKLAPLSAADFAAPQMVAMPLPACDAEALQRRLREEFSIEIPVLHWRDHTLLRLSVQGYNTQADMDRLVHAIGVIFA